ncbi:MAG: MerR family transcriptional regulator [Woeseia sp.]
MQVNELAKHAGVPAHVVRYYTQIGLLKPDRDPKNHYREYAASDVYRIRFIRRAKWLGFTLGDVKAILHDADQGVSPCTDVRKIIRIRAGQNHDRLQELRQLQARIEEAVSLWDSMPDRPPDHESLCHLIDAMAMVNGDLT